MIFFRTNVPTGFFERPDFEAVRSHLPADFQGPPMFAYNTGWRGLSEILPLGRTQVDFQAGTIRLEPGTMKNGEGRVFLFGLLPELADLLRAQWNKTLTLELETGQSIPSVFHWNDRGTIKPIHPKVFDRRWREARKMAGLPNRITHDFRRTAVRNLERAGVPRSVAMKLTGHKTEAVYRRYAIVCEADLSEGLTKLARLHDSVAQPELSHSSATISDPNGPFSPKKMVEAARVELASEDRQRTSSTCVADRLCFAATHAHRQA